MFCFIQNMKVSLVYNYNLHKPANDSHYFTNDKSCGLSFCARKSKSHKDSFEKTSIVSESKFIPLTYQDAKAVAEAKKYGQNVLGIKEYRGFTEKADLEVINWINESFVVVHNATKGKAIRPYLIDYYDYPLDQQNWYGAMEFTYPLGEITFNRDFLGSLNSRINTKIKIASAKRPVNYNNGVFVSDSFSVVKSKESLIPCIVKNKKGEYELSSLYSKNKNARRFEQNLNRYLKNPNGYSFKEKVSLNFTLNSLLNKKYYYFLKDEPVPSKPELEFSIVSPYKCIAHESAHLQHIAEDEKCIKLMREGVSNEKKLMWRKFLQGEEKTAAKITAYAASSPYEFVAETFAELVCNPNVRLEDDVIALYKRHDGPTFFRK